MVLIIPNQCWKSISKNFVGGFPMFKREHNYFFIVMDIFSKMCILIPHKKTIISQEDTIIEIATCIKKRDYFLIALCFNKFEIFQRYLECRLWMKENILELDDTLIQCILSECDEI